MVEMSKHTLLIVVCVLALGCPPASIEYTPERDAQAMQTVLGTWSASGITLSLCEDVERADSEASASEQASCQVEHVVRPGRGTAHVEEHKGVGCGGCPFAVEAHVTAELFHPKLAAPLSLTGVVQLGSGHDDDPYDVLPYRVSLVVEGRWIGGEIDGEGNLRVTSVHDLPELTEADFPTLRLGPGSCP
jgi:hypothetical protein